MFSRTSASRISETVEPLCGLMSTSPSAFSRLSASATGNRDTPKRVVSVALSSTTPGGNSRVTIASRNVSTMRSVAPPDEERADGTSAVATGSTVDFMLAC